MKKIGVQKEFRFIGHEKSGNLQIMGLLKMIYSLTESFMMGSQNQAFRRLEI